MFHGITDDIGTTCQVELFHGTPLVSLDGLGADIELRGDLSPSVPLGDQYQDFGFAVTQFVFTCRFGAGSLGQTAQYNTRNGGVEVGPPFGYGANGVNKVVGDGTFEDIAQCAALVNFSRNPSSSWMVSARILIAG